TPLAVPVPPTDVTADGGDAQATVSFTASTSSDVAYYTATAFPGGRSAIGTTSPITVTGLKNGTEYTLSVTATNASGTGPEPMWSNSVVPAEHPRPGTDPPVEPEPRAPVPAPPPVTGPRPKLPGH